MLLPEGAFVPLSTTALAIIVAAGPGTVVAIVIAYLFVSRKGEVRGVEGDTVSIKLPAKHAGRVPLAISHSAERRPR